MDDKNNSPTIAPKKETLPNSEEVSSSESYIETDEIEIMLSQRRVELKAETPPKLKKQSLFTPKPAKRKKSIPIDDYDDDKEYEDIENDDEDYQIDVHQTGQFPVIPVLITAGVTILVIVIAIISMLNPAQSGTESPQSEETTMPGISINEQYGVPEWIEVDLLPINDQSRPGTPITAVNGAVVHYVGNAGTSAKQNRAYFENLAKTKETYASSNFIIDIDGTILLLVPTNEVAYCSNDRNNDTISIETCHLDETGEFTEATYASLIKLLAWLSNEFNFAPTDIIRHHDITGKMCPLYYVENPDAWAVLISDVESAK